MLDALGLEVAIRVRTRRSTCPTRQNIGLGLGGFQPVGKSGQLDLTRQNGGSGRVDLRVPAGLASLFFYFF